MTDVIGRLAAPVRAAARRVRHGGGPLYYAQRPLRRARVRALLAAETGPEDVTVAIGIRNRRDHRLGNALRCLRAQTWPAEQLRIVVVDYGGDAGDVPWLTEQCASANAHMLRVDDAPRWNRSHCLNVAIARARTRYVLSTDVDILFAADYLERAIALLRDEPLGVVVSATFWDLPEDWTRRFARHAQVDGRDVVALHAMAERRQLDGVDHQNAGVNVARTALYHAVRGYDEAFVEWGAEDDDLIKRLCSYGAELVLTDSYYVHQWHPRYEGVDSPTLHAQIERNRRRLYSTHTVERNPDGWGRL